MRTLVLALVVCVGPFSIAPPGRLLAQESSPEAVAQYRVADGFQKRKLYPQAISRWTEFLAAHASDPLAANARFNLAVSHFRAKQLPKAAEQFRKVVADHPTFAQRDAARFNLGLVLYNVAAGSKKAEDYRAAAGEFAAIAEGDYAASAAYYRGECLYNAGDADGAIAAYRDLVTKHPEAATIPDALYALGTIQQEERKFADAVKSYEDFVGRFAEHELANECRLRLAMSLIELDRFGDAEKHLGPLVEANDFPHADYALLQTARCRFEQDDFPKAAELYESLPGRFAESTYAGPALVAAGRSRYRAEQFPQARDVLKKAVDRKGDEQVEAGYWLARSHLELNEGPAAVAAADVALSQATDDDWRARLAFLRIEARATIDDARTAAIDEFAEFATTYEKHDLAAEALYRAALAALRADQHGKAGTWSDALVERFPKHRLVPDALFVGGESRLLAAKPDPSAAEKLYQRLVAEHPKHDRRSVARVRIGFCLVERGEHDAAVSALSAAVPDLKDAKLVAEARLLEGRAHAGAKRSKEAATALRAAWAASQDWDRADEVLFALGTNLRETGDTAGAVREWTTLVDRFAKSPLRDHALYAVGETHSSGDRHDEAAAAFGRLVREHDKSDLVPAAHYGAAVAWYAKEDDAKAIAELDAVLTNHAESDVAADARLLRGLSRQRADRTKEAIADLEAYLDTKPKAGNAARARLALARAFTKDGAHDKTVTTLTALLEEQPKHPRADRIRYDLAFALRDAGKADEAATTFRSLAETHPESSLVGESWFHVGEFHESKKQHDEAATAYAAGLGKAKRAELRERLLYKVAWTEYTAEKHAEAAGHFEELVAKHGDGDLAKESLFLLGECRRATGEHEPALAWYLKAANTGAERHRAGALYRAGDSAAALGDWEASRTHYTALVEKHPKFERIAEARYGIGLSLQKQDKLDEARAVYEAITESTKTETAAKARFMMGECAFEQEKYETAIEDFLEAALGYGYEEWQVLGHLEAGRCFKELGRNDDARAEFETVVKEFPEHPRAKDAKALLADLEG